MRRHLGALVSGAGVRRRSLLIGGPALLAGCTPIPRAVDGAATRAGRGYVAAQLSSNRGAFIGFNPYGESTFGARFTENMVGAKGGMRFTEGDQSVVLEVDAGEYMWTRLYLGNQYAWLSATRFRVVPNAITYIGYIRLFVAENKYAFTVRDREADMQDFLREKYPNYARDLPFRKALAEVRIDGA